MKKVKTTKKHSAKTIKNSRRLKIGIITSLFIKFICAKVKPDETRIEGVNFTRGSIDFIQKDPELYRLATTSNGKLYYSPKLKLSAESYDIRTESDGAAYTKKILEAHYLSNQDIITIHEDNQKASIQLLQFNPTNKKKLIQPKNPNTKAESSIQLTELDITKLVVQEIPNSKNQDKLIFGLGVNIHPFKFNSQTRALETFLGFNPISVKGKVFYDLVAVYQDESEVYSCLALYFNEETKLHLLSHFNLMIDENGQLKMASEITWFDPKNFHLSVRAYLAKSGFRRDNNILSSAMKKLYLNQIYVAGGKRIGGISLKNGQVIDINGLLLDYIGLDSFQSASSIPNTEFVVSIGTTMPFFSVNTPESQGVQQSDRFATLVIRKFVNFEDSFGLIFIWTTYFESIHKGALVSPIVSISEDLHMVIFTSESGPSKINLIEIGSIFDLYCRPGYQKRFHTDEEYDSTGFEFNCQSPNTVMPFCEEINNIFDGSCSKCMPASGGTKVIKVHAPKPGAPMRSFCKLDSISCQAPKNTLNHPDCFNCQDIPNCKSCYEFFHPSCRRCEPGYGVDIMKYTCFPCSNLGPDCTSCYDARPTLQRMVCTGCVEGKFVNNLFACEPCSKNCIECINTAQCTKCSPGFSIVQNNDDTTSCVQCGENSYHDGKQCQTCSTEEVNPNCLECGQQGNCLKCKLGFRVNQEQRCESGCEANEFKSSSGECAKCSSQTNQDNCLKFKDVTGECEECKEGFNFDQNSNKCIKSCSMEKGEYLKNEDDQTCSKCSNGPGGIGCSQCTVPTGVCIKCQGGYYMKSDKTCINTCPNRQFISKALQGQGDFYECKDCLDGNCSSCQSMTGACSICKDGFQTTQSGGCRPKCSEFEYWSDQTKSCSKCSDKTENCENCEDSTGICSRCKTSFLLLENKSCKIYCKPSQYVVEELKIGKIECRDCSEVKESGKNCISCELKTGVCQNCRDGYFLTGKNYCQKKCNLEQFWTGNRTNSCSHCPSNNLNCLICQNMTGSCQKCKDTYLLLKNGTCRKSCDPEKEYWAEAENKCKKCKNNCQKCEDNTGVCLECNKGFTYNKDLPVCTKIEDDDKGDNTSKGTDEDDGVAKLLTEYFDPLTESVVLVYDRGLDENSKTNEELGLNLYLVNELGETEMEVTNEAIDADNLFKKRLYFLFPTQEVNKAKIGIKMKAQKTEDRLLEQETSPSNSAERHSNLDSEWLSLIENVNYYRTPNLPTIQNLGFLLNIASILVGAIIFIFSISNFFILVNTTQLIYMLSLFDTKLPSNVLSFSEMFKRNLIHSFSIDIIGIRDSSCKLPAPLYRAGLSCAALDGPLTPFLGYLAVILILRSTGQTLVNSMSSKVLQGGKITIHQIKRKQKLKLTKEERKFLSYLQFRKLLPRQFIICFMMSAQLDVFTACLVSLRYGRYENWKMIMNNSLSGLVILMYLVLIGYLVYSSFLRKKTKGNSKQSNGERTRAGPTTSLNLKSEDRNLLDGQIIGIKEKTATFVMVVNVVFGCLVVFGIIFPPIQLIVGTIVLVLVTIYILVTLASRRGWIAKIRITKFLVLSIVYFILTLIIPGFSINIREETRYNVFGILINLTLTSILCIVIVSTVIDSFTSKKKSKQKNEDTNREEQSQEFKIPNEANIGNSFDDGLHNRMMKASYKSSLRISVTNRIEYMNNMTLNSDNLKKRLSKQQTKASELRKKNDPKNTNPLESRLVNLKEGAKNGEDIHSIFGTANQQFDSVIENKTSPVSPLRIMNLSSQVNLIMLMDFFKILILAKQEEYSKD